MKYIKQRKSASYIILLLIGIATVLLVYKLNNNPLNPDNTLAAIVNCKADYDKSGTIDVIDFAKFGLNYKKTGIDCSLDLINSDCLLDLQDLKELAQGYKIVNACPTNNTQPVTANLFSSTLGKSQTEIDSKIDAVWNQLFYGDNTNQRIYYPVGTDQAYIYDVGNNRVSTEGMSYAMMIAVQLNKQDEFNKLWRWAKTYMWTASGQNKNYFAWEATIAGQVLDPNPAPDGEEYFATSLFFASKRWGDGTGIFNYKFEAQQILDTMLHQADDGVGTNMFDATNKMVVFTPIGTAALFTDPSYHLPAFYEVWAKVANKDNAYWTSAATISRDFFKNTTNATTGLAPDYAEFSGAAKQGWGDHADFRFDAWRVIHNSSLDYAWWQKDSRAVALADKLQTFFVSKGANYGNQFTLAGNQLDGSHSPGLVGMNGISALASNTAKTRPFIQEVWDLQIPNGQWRYYDGLLYFFAVLELSGKYKAYI